MNHVIEIDADRTSSEAAPYEKVIGRYEEYGRYLPAALLRLERERFLDRGAFLLRFRDPDSGAGLRMSDRDLLLATEELSEGHFPASIMFPGPVESEDALLGAAWKVLKDALGLLYTDTNGVTWGIGEDREDNLILVNVTAREKERVNTVEVCESCFEREGVSLPYFNDSDTIEFFGGRCEICGSSTRVTYGVRGDV